MGLSCHDLVCQREAWSQGHPSAVCGISATFDRGEICGITGPDGCGKGLLLNILGLLEKPDAGTVRFGETFPLTLDSAALTDFRNRTIGFLFSQVGLLPAFTVAENVAMPLFRICGADPATAQERTLEVLEACGLAEEGNRMAGRLPVPQMWRVALARALVHGPEVLIAISPRHSEELLPLARRAAEDSGLCILWAGEPEPLGEFAHRVLTLDKGRVTGDLRP